MPGMIALVGGEEFRQYCREMDREIMRASGGNPARVVVIPTAAVTGPAKAANDGVTHFAALGGNAGQLMVLEREQAEDAALVQGVADADVIYFTGGNPSHLLDTLRDSRLLAAILQAVERGAVLAGSSAGAMVMGSLMRRPRAGEWVTGLGVASGTAVLAHHERSNPSEVVQQLAGQIPADLTVLGIDAQTGCLGQPGNWQVVGSGKLTVYREGGYQIYQAGETISYAN